MFRKETRKLVCKLLPIEVAAKDADARRQILAAGKFENERLGFVEQATEARKQVKGAQAKAMELAKVSQAGEEQRDVTCEWRPHPSAPRMQLHRLDVNEEDSARIIDHRQMTKAEERGEFIQVGAGDHPSSSEASSDSAAANESANGKSGKRGKAAAKAPDPCPVAIAEPDDNDPRKDTLCSGECQARKWACEAHVTLPPSAKVHAMARRQRRNALLAEDAQAAADATAATERAEAESQSGVCHQPAHPGASDSTICGLDLVDGLCSVHGRPAMPPPADQVDAALDPASP